ncbi:putative bifunctional diguanylate cyclase/phosphodiesterase [Planobispora siamensis]|uniref:Diguanylate cyclase (GGDEF) domain-containing protein n=1 Tax=Planobispora siamensis TaxID=936338 RepID=A0A8J3WNU0_9ACTN|nr:bifunctional diguanylate cyclase/phosphodiesterase [Planobispora siamensis]GIH94246.1 hypothetical protein Psi01_48760 [Planobispora siamensis]
MNATVCAARTTLARLTGHPRLWVASLALGGVLAAASPGLGLLSPLLDTCARALLQGLCAVSVIVGIDRYGLADLRPWRLIRAAAVTSWVAIALVRGLGEVWLRLPAAADLYQVAIVTGYVLLLAGLVLLGLQAGGSPWAGMLDGGIISIGVAMPLWVFLIDPALDHRGNAATGFAFLLIIPLIDLFIMGIVMRMTLDSAGMACLALLSASTFALFAADSLHLFDTVMGRTAGPLSTIGWLAFSALVGAAALHPSMAAVRNIHTPVVSSRTRITIFLVLALLSPLISGLGRVLVHADTARDPVDDVVFTVLTVLLAVLLVLRLSTIARIAERQSAQLRTALHRQQALQHSLTHRAYHDPLTGLANRSLLRKRLQDAVTAHATEPGTPPPALLLLNLDGFKDINDTYGHALGDELLTVAARRLGALTAEGRILARLGGDEFALLLPAATVEQAHAAAQQMLDLVRSPYRLSERELHVTASIGVLAGQPVAEPSDALRDSDLALNTAKSGGKNRIVVFDHELRAARLRHTEIITGLRRALERNEFTLAYQPIVDVTTGKLSKVEALLRWRPSAGRPVSPAVFIPLAEESGLIVDIGRWVLEHACADAAGWYERYGLTVTVNVSGRQLRETTFSDTVLAALTRHGLPRHALTLEITESMLLATGATETARIVGVLSDLRELGIRIALDDFGTGYSSLAYLRTLPVDILKIDRSFITPLTGTDHDEQAHAFTQSIVELAARLRLSAIAEGVESAQQAQALRQMGCRLVQGYLFSPPVEAAHIDALLEHGPDWQPRAA